MAVSTAKIDLHLHLDGSLPNALSYELARERGVLPREIQSYEDYLWAVKIPAENASLYEFLSHFDLPLAILQDSEALERSVSGLIDLLASQGLIYAEIRFAPQLHTKRGLTPMQAVDAAARGLREGLARNPDFGAGLILCAMNLGDASINRRENLFTVSLADYYLGHGVVAVDLAGAEGTAPMADYSEIFERARVLNVPYTIHAGESAGPQNVATALSFGTKRIGHGLSAIEDPAVIELLKEVGATLEMCVTSNHQCKLVPSPAQHPIHRLLDLGVKVTCNTDNMTISGINLAREHQVLREELGFGDEELLALNQNAVNAAFVSPKEKQALLEKLTSR